MAVLSRIGYDASCIKDGHPALHHDSIPFRFSDRLRADRSDFRILRFRSKQLSAHGSEQQG